MNPVKGYSRRTAARLASQTSGGTSRSFRFQDERRNLRTTEDPQRRHRPQSAADVHQHVTAPAESRRVPGLVPGRDDDRSEKRNADLPSVRMSADEQVDAAAIQATDHIGMVA